MYVCPKRILDITRKWTQDNFKGRLNDWSCVESAIAVSILKHFVYRDEISEHTIHYCRGISDIVKFKHEDLVLYDEDTLKNLYINFKNDDMEMFRKHVVNFYSWIEDKL